MVPIKDEDMYIIEEFVEHIFLIAKKTGVDIFQSSVISLDKLNVNWKQMMSVFTDGNSQIKVNMLCPG